MALADLAAAIKQAYLDSGSNPAWAGLDAYALRIATAIWNNGPSSGGGAPLTNTAPVNATKSTAAVGVSSEAARADHKHDVTTATASSLTPGGSSTEGASTSLARADHTHALPAFGTAAGTFAEGNHTHTPAAHASTHAPGGSDPLDAVLTESVYLPDLLHWIDTGSTLPGPARNSAITKVGSTWYLYGGFDSYGTTKRIWHSTDLLSWTADASELPIATGGHTAIQTESYVHLIGLYSGGVGYADVLRASISSPTVFTAHTSLPAGRGWGAIFVCGSYVYLIGGYDASGNHTSSIYYISLADLDAGNPWSLASETFPTTLGTATSFAAIGDALVIAGCEIGGSTSKRVYTAHVAAPREWRQMTLELIDSDWSRQVVQTGDTVTLWGGAGATRQYTAHRSQPWNLIERVSSAAPANLHGAPIAIKDGYVYALGGLNSGAGLVSTIYRTAYRVTGLAEVTASTTQGRRVLLPDGQITMQSPSERAGIAHWTHYAYAPRAA